MRSDEWLQRVICAVAKYTRMEGLLLHNQGRYLDVGLLADAISPLSWHHPSLMQSTLIRTHIANILMPHTHILWLLIETSGHKFLKGSGIVPSEFWRVVLWYEEEHTHWVEVGVRGLPLCQLNGCDAQGPDVGLGCGRGCDITVREW